MTERTIGKKGRCKIDGLGGLVSEKAIVRRSLCEKDYAERPWTTINLKNGDVARSINLHVAVAVLAQHLPAICPGRRIARSRSYAPRLYLDARTRFIRLMLAPSFCPVVLHRRFTSPFYTAVLPRRMETAENRSNYVGIPSDGETMLKNLRK